MKKGYLRPQIKITEQVAEKLCNLTTNFISNWHMAEIPEGEADEDIF